MSSEKNTFFCCECKKILLDLDDLLLVEDKQRLTFCSENCIQDFFADFKKHLLQCEGQLRKQLDLSNEPIVRLKNRPDVLKETILKPLEVLKNSTGHGPEYFSFVGRSVYEGEEYSSLVICLLYDSQPSFVLGHVVSANQTLIDKLKLGNAVETEIKAEMPDESVPVDAETMEQVEQLKSKYLADIIEERADTDIPIESFALYDEYAGETLSEPDEVYQFAEESGETIYTYIKSFELEKISFYYFVVCLLWSSDMEEDEDVVVPIISFPSLDGEFCSKFRKGEQLHGTLRS